MDLEEQEDDQSSFEKRWGWLAILNRVSNDDITKHEQILEKTLVEILNHISYLIDKDNEIIKQQKRSTNKI